MAGQQSIATDLLPDAITVIPAVPVSINVGDSFRVLATGPLRYADQSGAVHTVQPGNALLMKYIGSSIVPTEVPGGTVLVARVVSYLYTLPSGDIVVGASSDDPRWRGVAIYSGSQVSQAVDGSGQVWGIPSTTPVQRV